MHEYSVAEALVRRAEEEAHRHGAASVHRIEVRLGEESGVEAELLERAFTLVREGGPCQGAALAIVSVPVRWSCPGCGVEPAPGAPLFCGACQRPARLVAGDEIELSRMEIEVN